MVIITFALFFTRNIDRLIDENKKYSYNPLNDTSYRFLDQSFKYKNFIEKHKKNNTKKIKEIYKGRYLIIN